MKLSLDQYLRLFDFEIVYGLAATLSSREKKERLWAFVKQEEDRVANLTRDFPCDIVVTRRMSSVFVPGCVFTYGGLKVEGEIERKLKEGKPKFLPGMSKFWHFWKGSAVSHSWFF